MNHGIYIHFPFCRKKCGYCTFYSVSDLHMIDKYIDRLIFDITETLSGEEKIYADTIYFGGGTPSLMEPSSISKIMNCIYDAADISGNAEVTLEMNPEDAYASRIAGYVDAGVNRIVLGVQTLTQKFHNAVGRSGSLCMDDILNEFFCAEGFNHCVDLITGIPGHSADSIKPDVEKILKYHPEHISAYILSVEKGASVYKKIIRNEEFDNMQIDVFRSVMDLLVNAGYDHYEISNFSLNGNRSRHNMKYWKFEPYLGFGPSAHSFYKNIRYSNEMNVEEYINSGKIKISVDERNSNSSIAEILLTGLRLSDGISLSEISEKTGARIPEVVMDRMRTLASDGKILMESDGLICIEKDYFFSYDSIIYDIVQDII